MCFLQSYLQSASVTELDALEADMGSETTADSMPSYLQPDKDSDLDSELNLPSAPSGHTSGTSQANPQVHS